MAQVWWVKAVAGLGLAVVLLSNLKTTASAAGGAEAPLPRFAALHADKVNLRTGPGDRYPIQWVYLRKDWPVEVVAQFDHWRRVRDWEGTEGWVHEKMITQQREVIVSGATRALRQSPDPNAPMVARAEPGVVAKLDECRGDWCRIAAGEITGWVQRADIWGVPATDATR
jgi:SH3-like domain-containing protein